MSTLLAQRNAKQWLVHSYLFSTAKSNPEWKHIETTSSKHLVCKHNPAELFAAISSLAETYSITATASFSHVSADADFPFICASAFGGGESSLRLRKSPWHQSVISRFAVKLTMTAVKSNHVGSNPLLVRHGMSIHIRGLGPAIFESALMFILSIRTIALNKNVAVMCAIHWDLLCSIAGRHVWLRLLLSYCCPFPFHLCLPVRRRRVQSPSSEVSLAPIRHIKICS